MPPRTPSVTITNYDILALVKAVCDREAWELKQTYFYTGMPVLEKDKPRHDFWARKLAVMGRQGIKIFKRNVRYRTKEIRLPGGSTLLREIAEEKGIDVRIAIDLMRFAFEKRFDVALVFSQDQDLSEAAREVRVFPFFYGVEMPLWFQLEVIAGTGFGPGRPTGPGTSIADFANTASIAGFVLFDPNMQPLDEVANITSGLGISYQQLEAPEPTTLTLLSTVLVLLAMRRKYGTR